MINVPLSGQRDILGQPRLQDVVKSAEDDLGDSGRVLLRPSGTEPLIRVMVEGQDSSKVEDTARQLAQAVSEAAAG